MRNPFFAKKKKKIICSTFYFFYILEQENTEPVVEAQNPKLIPEQPKELTEGQPETEPKETIIERTMVIEENQEAEKVLDAVEESKKEEENVENAIVEPLENSDKETEETIATNDVTEGIEDKEQAIAENFPEVVPETVEQSETKVEPEPPVEPQIEPQVEPQVEPQAEPQLAKQPESQPEPVDEIPVQVVEATENITETEPSSVEKPTKTQGPKSKQSE